MMPHGNNPRHTSKPMKQSHIAIIFNLPNMSRTSPSTTTIGHNHCVIGATITAHNATFNYNSVHPPEAPSFYLPKTTQEPPHITLRGNSHDEKGERETELSYWIVKV
ncbi:hypothetical protein DEO72_LG1g2858 [Vigna unguiculata]|uniref:Uncharacterized protein n=1 Tax=Vigna unguiculata TaxID=3917 RepID=A0A4D6KVC1_VIGUN|nr:hypothetical protein DEO72_LG1g2858 [Vigna unguiculata]